MSTPKPAKPAEVAEARMGFLNYTEELKKTRKLLSFYPRVGRGAVAILDVESNDELHEFLNKWLTFVEVYFDVYPLVEPEKVKNILRQTLKDKDR
ncbi:MAG: DUF3303 family protein [Candidatus Bathyarchaeia archaeon]